MSTFFPSASVQSPDRDEQKILAEALDRHRAGDGVGAEILYRQILASNPRHADALHLLGVLALQAGAAEQAVRLIAHAIVCGGAAAIYYANLGNALHRLDRFDLALEAYQKALVLDPGNPDTANALAHTLHLQGHYAEARAGYEKILAAHPGHADARFNLSLLELLEGDFVSGFRNYEARWKAAEHRAQDRGLPQPLWRGEPLAGRRILLHAEQGLGDSLQFLRYLPQVAAAGGKILLDLPSSLRLLAATSFPNVTLLAPGLPLPAFECHCPLMSLPLACGSTAATIPAAIPYLAVPIARRIAAAAHDWPAEGLRVGLVWAGSPTHHRDRQRSIPLPKLAEALGGLAGIHFYSLQVGPASGEQKEFPGLAPLPLDPEDFATTAALVEQLDLVITVDTALAHLAGALGKPVWLLLAHVPDWRWQRERADSPWYPTLRLFRQRVAGEWAPVLSDLRSALALHGHCA